MTIENTNLRKAALLIRSLDADSAAALLGQLSPAEAAELREAMRQLGPIDAEDQEDLLAELRRSRPMAKPTAGQGVELTLSHSTPKDPTSVDEAPKTRNIAARRFDFLERAPTRVLVAHLSREHAQTVAVVLTHLAPAHAAEVLAALPETLRADAISRLSTLGDADTDSLAALESELAAWAAQRAGGGVDRRRQREAMAAILAAADGKSRAAILGSLEPQGSKPVERSLPAPPRSSAVVNSPKSRGHVQAPCAPLPVQQPTQRPVSSGKVQASQVQLPPPQPRRAIHFDHLIHLDDPSLARVLHAVDPNTLALAMAGSRDELVDRICGQMPKRTAKAFRRELRRLGPTRLSDVDTAQRIVAQVASEHLAGPRRSRFQPAA